MPSINRRTFLLGTSALAAIKCLPLTRVEPDMTINGRIVLYYAGIDKGWIDNIDESRWKPFITGKAHSLPIPNNINGFNIETSGEVVLELPRNPAPGASIELRFGSGAPVTINTNGKKFHGRT